MVLRYNDHAVLATRGNRTSLLAARFESPGTRVRRGKSRRRCADLALALAPGGEVRVPSLDEARSPPS